MKKQIQLSYLQSVKSSNVDMIGFEGDQIFVKFVNGGTYSYNKANIEVFEDMCKSESVGKFLNSKVKGVFEFNKLEDVELVKREKNDDKKTN